MFVFTFKLCISTNKLFKSCFLCLSVSISNDFELWSFLFLVNFSAQKIQLGKKGVTLRAKFKAHAWLWSFFRCSNFFVVVNQNKGESKEKKRLNKRIKKFLQRQTNPNKLPDFVCVYAFGQLFRAKSISRWPFLLWYKNKLPQNKIKFGFEKKGELHFFFVCSNFSFPFMCTSWQRLWTKVYLFLHCFLWYKENLCQSNNKT